MIEGAIYNKADGEITGFVTAPAEMIDIQRGPDQGFFPCCPRWATHIIDGQPVSVAPSPPEREELLAQIRFRRDALLKQCDWTQMPDSPLPTEKQLAWREYRQALRDFPPVCDPENPAWPTPPQ